MGRTSDARERLVDAARGLIASRSYHAVGVSDICADAGVRKGSFYHFFESKQALTRTALDAHWADQEADLRRLLHTDAPPLQRLRNLLDHFLLVQEGIQRDCGTVRGCTLANVALQLDAGQPDLRARLAEIFDAQVALVLDVLREAAAAGDVPASVASAATARSVIAQIEGSVLFARLHDDPGVLAGLPTAVGALLGVPGGLTGAATAS